MTQQIKCFPLLSPSTGEIRQVVFSMGLTSSPDTGGLPALFYKHYWNIIHAEVIDDG